MLDRKKLLSADVSATRTGGKAAIVDVNLPAQHIADKYVFFSEACRADFSVRFCRRQFGQ